MELNEKQKAIFLKILERQKAKKGFGVENLTSSRGLIALFEYSKKKKEQEALDDEMAANRETPEFEDELLKRIREKEAGRLGYDSYIKYWKSSVPAPEKPVSQMTFAEVYAYQDKLLSSIGGSAIGGYQILKRTLKDAQNYLGIKDDEIFSQEMQDRIAKDYLLRAKRKKGYTIDDYKEGKISKEDFAWSLSTEWASLPVLDERVRRTDNGDVNISPGQSYYKGVGDNRSLFKGEKLTDYSTFLDSGVSNEMLASNEDGSQTDSNL